MPCLDIAQRLRTEVPGLKRVGISPAPEELQRTIQGGGGLPVAWVVLLSEAGAAPTLANGLTRQRHTLSFAVILASGRGAAGDERAYAEHREVKRATRRALIGWLPPGVGLVSAAGAVLVEGEMLAAHPGALLWLDSYSLSGFFEAA